MVLAVRGVFSEDDLGLHGQPRSYGGALQRSEAVLDGETSGKRIRGTNGSESESCLRQFTPLTT